MHAQIFSNALARSALVKVWVQASMPFDVGLDDAICDDLNHDGVTDFVVNLWGHGNGLGASFRRHRVVRLHYRLWVVPTMSPGADDFVTFGKIEPVVMATRRVRAQRDRPGEPRSYLVYDLWAFHCGEPILANSIDGRFPKWVRFTSKPNWGPAISVTDDDKRLRTIRDALKPFPKDPLRGWAMFFCGRKAALERRVSVSPDRRSGPSRDRIANRVCSYAIVSPL